MYYFALVDQNGVLCVDQVAEESQDEDSMQRLPLFHPHVIYFVV